ncbi:BLUF domain-containing protein [Vibrio sp. SCSIO 43135]|uniref:BLUF domain-containing protein n=1 Tax=Vibrio paucivorans TaxID=2829489 RepID=A0A9X3HQG4_9VIBR|nr:MULTISPECIES: BLUF domain-containing protein [Vibrio]MCW8333445.1 BLUF domain-containing protein [Vibrio paucivorans]USD42943.1 BLUF domain-containing protein [Vibrio sp. SCSIO 43135]
MSLVRLIYVSKITNQFAMSSLEDILQVARKNNEKNNITGMLCFNRNFFLQSIEGTRDSVNATYNKILNDERHHNAIILEYSEISARDFADWSMGYVPSSSLTAPLNLQFSGTTEFDPYSLSGQSAYQFLLKLKGTLPNI